jgi:hypothetical protein
MATTSEVINQDRRRLFGDGRCRHCHRLRRQHVPVAVNRRGLARSLSTRRDVHLPGVVRDVAEALVDEAHKICPYSKATRGNIDVSIRLVYATAR